MAGLGHAGWGSSRIKRSNECHPERRHYAKGLCWTCYRNRPEFKAKTRAYYQANKDKYREQGERQRASYRREAKRYGTTPEYIFAMLERQSNTCAICGKAPKRKRLAIDHDHTSGAVREMLCHPCNTALGALRDDPILCDRAATYLRRHSVLAKGTAA